MYQHSSGCSYGRGDWNWTTGSKKSKKGGQKMAEKKAAVKKAAPKKAAVKKAAPKKK
jgi:hypothetical protein